MVVQIINCATFPLYEIGIDVITSLTSKVKLQYKYLYFLFGFCVLTCLVFIEKGIIFHRRKRVEHYLNALHERIIIEQYRERVDRIPAIPVREERDVERNVEEQFANVSEAVN